MASDRPVREAENRLERFNADREKLLSAVERRVVARRVAESKTGGDASLEYVLNDVAYNEIKRLDKSGNGAADRWRDLSRRLLSMSEDEKQSELRDLVRYYGRDVVGNFDPRVTLVRPLLPNPHLLDFERPSVGQDFIQHLGQDERVNDMPAQFDLFRKHNFSRTPSINPFIF